MRFYLFILSFGSLWWTGRLKALNQSSFISEDLLSATNVFLPMKWEFFFPTCHPCRFLSLYLFHVVCGHQFNAWIGWLHLHYLVECWWGWTNWWKIFTQCALRSKFSSTTFRLIWAKILLSFSMALLKYGFSGFRLRLNGKFGTFNQISQLFPLSNFLVRSLPLSSLLIAVFSTKLGYLKPVQP